MADFSQMNVFGYQDVNHAGDISAGNVDDGELIVDADQLSVAAMRTRLDAIDSDVYTTARMNQMTVNDMLFAIRTNDYATSL